MLDAIIAAANGQAGNGDGVCRPDPACCRKSCISQKWGQIKPINQRSFPVVYAKTIKLKIWFEWSTRLSAFTVNGNFKQFSAVVQYLTDSILDGHAKDQDGRILPKLHRHTYVDPASPSTEAIPASGLIAHLHPEHQ